MPCTCTIEDGKLVDLCRLHRAYSNQTWNDAIRLSVDTLRMNGADVSLITKVSELKLAESGEGR